VVSALFAVGQLLFLDLFLLSLAREVFSYFTGQLFSLSASQFLIRGFLLSAFPVSAFQHVSVSAFDRVMSAFQHFSLELVNPFLK
jgi:hypothetical protein